MYILGIACYRHDSSAALIKDGEVIASVQEDRFNRDKHSGVFPSSAIRYCLKRADISVAKVQCISFFCKPWIALFKRIPMILRYFPKSINWSDEYTGTFWSMINMRKKIKDDFNLKKAPKIYFVEHHLAHLASAFYLSPFRKAALLSMDAAGEYDTTVLGVGEDNDISILKRISLPNSLGYFYNAICQYLGFRHFAYRPDDAEGKVMALSSYGKPYYGEIFKDMLRKSSNGGYRVNLKYFNYHLGKRKYFTRELEKVFGPRRQQGDLLERRHLDIASSLQNALEDAVLRLVDYLYKVTKVENLCLAGGVALNCVMNQKIISRSSFKNIFVQPDAGDSGTALGSALYVHHALFKKNKRSSIMNSVFWGPEYSNEECELELKRSGLSYQYYEDVANVVAHLLAEGKILGWFQGRLECGPRALGDRSILADPRNPNMKDILNKKVKFRESFRPFAPSVLEEEMSGYFEFDKPLPFMLFAVKVKESKRHLLPAVTHIDGTARLQTVNKYRNPLFWSLIKEFSKITGVPALLNTSFNIKGEPIVNSPSDAINCFKNTGLDALVLGNFVVIK